MSLSPLWREVAVVIAQASLRRAMAAVGEEQGGPDMRRASAERLQDRKPDVGDAERVVEPVRRRTERRQK